MHDFPSAPTKENSTEMNDQASMHHVNKALKVLTQHSCHVPFTPDVIHPEATVGLTGCSNKQTNQTATSV